MVTADKAFYKGRNYGNGLAEALEQETENSQHSVYIFHKLSALLETIKNEVKIDEKALANQFWESARSSIESILNRNSFAVVGDPTVAVQLFATENPNQLYTEFSISYQCEDLTKDERFCGVLHLKGDCTYLINKKQFDAFRNQGEELLFKTKDGEDKSVRNVVIFANSIVIGHKTVEHSIKYKLDN